MVEIDVFHCSKLRPAPEASHVNETDVSATTPLMLTLTLIHREINDPLLAFLWLLLGYHQLKGEPASKRNKIKKREAVSCSR